MTEIKAKKVLFKNRDGESLIPYIGEDYVKQEDMVEIDFVPKDSMEEVPCIVETYVNGTSWYRVWSDGWCEQGGACLMSGATQNAYWVVSLLKNYINTEYSIQITFGGDKATDRGTANNLYAWSDSKTTSQFYWGAVGGNANAYKFSGYWQTCGYIA